MDAQFWPGAGQNGGQYKETAKQNARVLCCNRQPAFKRKRHPVFLCFVNQKELSLENALTALKSEHGCERITVQTGGTLNGLFLREKLFDYVDIVVAPILIGGKDTSTLIDGESLFSQSELSKLGALKLQECVVLENSYLRLRYEVIR